jgi:TfoX/Sxy family transcriptional regulator of competence genes
MSKTTHPTVIANSAHLGGNVLFGDALVLSRRSVQRLQQVRLCSLRVVDVSRREHVLVRLFAEPDKVLLSQRELVELGKQSLEGREVASDRDKVLRDDLEVSSKLVL